jgi:hypothetical protein
VTEVFDKNGSAENYRIVDLSNGKAYWLREKKFTIIDIPYSADTTKKVEYIDDLANHAAYQLGVWHGQQSSAKRYVSMVSKDVDAFQEAIKVFVKDYLEKVEAEFE